MLKRLSQPAHTSIRRFAAHISDTEVRDISNTLPRVCAFALALSLLMGFPANDAAAQLDNTFTVTVEDKTSAHPESDRGWPEGFVVDEQQGKSIAVVRGETYTFQMNDVPAIHPFYLTTSSIGVGAEPYNEGVSDNFVTGNESITFTPDESTPDLLYYQCGTHEYMGWRIFVMDRAEVDVQTVAEGLTSPLTIAQVDDGTDRLFVVDQAGMIRVIEDGTLLEEPFLDVTDRMVELSEDYDERGLLGLAFHQDYESSGRFFVYYSAPLRDGAPDGWDHTATISEFQVSSDPNVADVNSERILLEVDQPQGNHNGGTLLFGPNDPHLYISLGDGGGADDTGEGHVADWYDANEGGNAQNVEEGGLLGKILRIDVDADDPYGIPSDNPFVGTDGRDEIFAYGFRNPYRMAFDMEAELGLLVGDAGQNRWEEVSQIPLGGNMGWNVKEGTHCFSTANPEEDAANCPDEVGAGHPDEGAPLIDPVIEYKNFNQEDGVGLVVVGGYVYRGSAMPEFDGKYIFGDWSYSFSEPEGLLFLATPQDEGRWPIQKLNVVGRDEGELHDFILGFGQDNDGEVYVLTTDNTGPTGETGTVYKFVPAENVAEESPTELPERITLRQNFPNPFNPSTNIRFSLPSSGQVTLTIYDMLGREVATIVDGVMAAGSHNVTWDGRTDSDVAAPSGTYVYRLRTAETTTSRLMTLMK